MYIIFFGKSQSFEFHAFDENGIINDFDSVIKDFELLESKWFTIDRTDNKNILARYEFASINKKYCLLKLYGFAQAAGGARVEGSTYGVAFLSQEPLSLSVNNIKIISLLLKYFSDLCLSNSKFKKPDFKEDSYSIWKAFANQIGYGKIEKGKYFSKSENNNPIGFVVTDFEQVSIISESYLSKSTMLYFSTDVEHLKRTRDRWDKKFEFYSVHQKGISSYTDPVIKENKQISNPSNLSLNNGVNNSEIRLSELEKELNAIRKKLKKDTIYFKKIILFTSILSAVFAFSFFYKMFNSGPDVVIDKPTPPIEKNNNNDFSSIIYDSVLVDTSRSQVAADFFKSYLIYKRDKSADTLEKKKKLLKSLLESGRKLKIDSTTVKKAVNIK